MKLLSRFTLINLLCMAAFPAAADDYNYQYNQQTSQNTSNLVQYLLNLGGFLGYDLTQSPTANNQTISQQLLNISATQLAENYVFNTFLGAIPVDAVSTTMAQFVPSNIAGSSIINSLANNTYTYQNYSTPATSQQGVSVSSLMDQQTFQQDPVSQSVLNILGTPSSTYCMNNDGTSWTSNCPLLYENLVSYNVIGAIPNTYTYFTYNYNQQFISQLNTNSLLGPLLYSTDSGNPPSTSSGNPNQQNQGLTAQNQIQQAANFIRYVSGSVIPTPLPKRNDYDALYSVAVPPPGATHINRIEQYKAQAVLSNYFANLRVYAAQTSVGMSNLYYILSRRLPQNQSGSNPILTSQAMSEFNMATWRLFNPDMSPNKQWINQINGASSATVQKEIATLLAEMNYQMYLDRQLQERILLTNTIMLMQNTRNSQPDGDFSNPGAATAATTH